MKQIHQYGLSNKIADNDVVCVYKASDSPASVDADNLYMLNVVNEHFQINPSYLMNVIVQSRQSGITHPHIAKILDYGEVDGQQYFVSDYMGDRTLASILGKPIPPSVALDVISQVASALHFLSLQGYIHGNIRPDNIFFDLYNNVVISSTLLIPKEQSLPDYRKNSSSRYISPEVVNGSVANESSDLYSIGVILYELLTGEIFTDRPSTISNNPVNVDEMIPYLPRHCFVYQPIINKLLAKNPKQRFRDGLALIDALNDYEAKVAVTSKEHLSEEFDFKASKSQQPTLNLSKNGNTVPVSQSLQKLELRTEVNDFPLPLSSDADMALANDHLAEAKPFAVPEPPKKIKLLAMSSVAAIISVAIGMVVVELNTNHTQLQLTDSTQKEETISSHVTPRSQIEKTLLEKEESERQHRQFLQAAKIAPLISREEIISIKGFVENQQFKVKNLLAQASNHVEQLQFTTPHKDNAYERYLEVLTLDPGNQQAVIGIDNIASAYIYMAQQQIEQANYKRAQHYVGRGLNIQSSNSRLRRLSVLVEEKLTLERESFDPVEAFAFDQ